MKIVKVLDFDDCGFGWHLFDLATILLFFRGDGTYHDRIWSAVIEGYRSVRDLPDEQLPYMPLFYLLDPSHISDEDWVRVRNTSQPKNWPPCLQMSPVVSPKSP